MRLARNSLIVCLCASLLLLAQSQFKTLPADSYPSHQNVGKMKLAAVKYESDEETRMAFGKVNPNEYGILPVYLILENTGDQTLLLDKMRVTYQYSGNEVMPTPAQDLAFAIGPKRPSNNPKYPLPIPLPAKKNPLNAVELQTRAFAAKTMLRGENAAGFFYFETRHHRNAIIYVTGVREALTNKELFYAEVPLDSPTPN